MLSVNVMDLDDKHLT